MPELNNIRDRLKNMSLEMKHDVESHLDEMALRSRLNHYRRQILSESYSLQAAIANTENIPNLEQLG